MANLLQTLSQQKLKAETTTIRKQKPNGDFGIQPTIASIPFRVVSSWKSLGNSKKPPQQQQQQCSYFECTEKYAEAKTTTKRQQHIAKHSGCNLHAAATTTEINTTTDTHTNANGNITQFLPLRWTSPTLFAINSSLWLSAIWNWLSSLLLCLLYVCDFSISSASSSSSSSSLWQNRQRPQYSTSSSSSSPTSSLTSNKSIRGLFTTLLVLSLFHNNVLETSAASMKSSKREITSTPSSLLSTTQQSDGKLSYPLKSFSTLTPQISPNRTQIYHSGNLSATTKTGQTTRRQELSQSDFNFHSQKSNDEKLLPPKQKRQQRIQQWPQYLASTQETTFHQNGMTLESMQHNTLQSMSIVDGRLTVPMDNIEEHQQQPIYNGTNRSAGSSGGGISVDGNNMIPFPKRSQMPVFDFGMPQNITARSGHMEAVLKCRVDSLGDKSISWIRKRDLHILTVGKTTYTSDQRFHVTESKDSREWTLHVKSPQARDSGIYECQVNTEPKMSMGFRLNIIEISSDTKAVITGPTDLYVKVGSAITLTCLVRQPSIRDIGPIHWYRGQHLLTPYTPVNNDERTHRGDFITPAALTSKSNSYDQHAETEMYDNNVEEEENMSEMSKNEITQDFRQRVALEQQLCDTITSRLRISNAQKLDSGNYTCQPATASSTSVMVHVINDENPAAMQKSETAGAMNL